MKRPLRRLAKALVALPYRLRFGRLGREVRIMPPLMVQGGRLVRVGDRVIIEQFAGLSVVRGGLIEIGDECEVRCFARIEAHNGSVRLGRRTSVNPFSLLSGFGGLSIGDDVRIGSHCVVLSSTHRFESTEVTIREQGVVPAPTIIEDDAWLGAGCTILGGVRVGRGAIIGAGAVVTRDVAPWNVVAGVPARVMASRRDTSARQGI